MVSMFDPLPSTAAPTATPAPPPNAPPPASDEDTRRALLMRAFAPQYNIAQRLTAGAASIPTAPLGLYNLASGVTRAVTGSPLPGGDTAGEWSQTYNQGVHNILGISEPNNIVDRAAEIGGSMFVGPLGASAGVPTLVRGALSGVAGLPSTIRGAAGWTAGLTGLSELLSPSSAQAAPAASAAPTGAAPTQPTAPQVAQAAPRSMFDPIDAPAAPQRGAASQVVPAPAVTYNTSMFGDTPVSPPPPPSSPMDWAVPAAVATGLAALVLHRYLRPPAPGAVRTSITGLNAAEENATPIWVRAQANLIDQSAPATYAARTVNPSGVGDARNAMWHDFTPQATAVRRMHAWTEGVADGTRLSEAPRVLTQDIAGLSPQQRQAYEQLRVIENEAGNIATGGKTTLHENPVNGQPWVPGGVAASVGNTTRAVLQEAQNLRSDPVVAATMNRTQALQRSMWQYAFDQGLITAAEHQQMVGVRAGFAPLITAREVPNIFMRMAESTSTGSVRNELVNLQQLMKQGGAEAGTRFISSAPAMEQMLNTLMTTAAHNRARISILDNVATARPGNPYYNVVRQVPRGSEDTIGVWRNGRETHYEVSDPALRTSLRVIPDAADVVMGIIDRTRQFGQAAATGAGNPAFGFVSNIWNGMVGSVTRPAGTKVGLFGGDLIGGGLESLIGSARGIGAMATRNMSQMLEDSIRNNGFLSRSMTPQTARYWADKLTQTWQRSTLYAMQEQGAAGIGRITMDTHIPNRHSMLDAMNPEYASRSPGLSKAWALYRDTLDMIRSGTSIQFFARNRGAVGDLTAGRMAAELTGNAGVRGSGQLARGTMKAVPYGNVGVQEYASMGRSIRENPAAFAGRTALAVGIPAIAMVEAGRRVLQGDESRDYFDYLYRRMTPEEAARYIVIPIPGMRPEDMPHIALPNSMRVPWVVARDGYAYLSGATPDATYERARANFLRGGVLTAQPFSTPPIVNALLGGAAGVTLNVPGRGSTMATVTPMRGPGAVVGEPETLQGLPPDASPMQRALYNNMLNSVVTSLATVAGQTAMETARAYEMATRAGGTGRPLSDAAATAMMPTERTLSMFGVSDMWGQSRRVSTSNQDSRDMSDARSELQRINNEYNTNVRNQGSSGSRRSGAPDANAAQNTGTRDPMMNVLMSRAGDFERSLSRNGLARLGFLRAEQNNITSSPSYSPRERAEQRANIDRQILEQQRELLQQVRQFEFAQSQFFRRRIRLSDISRTGRVDDLPPFNPQ